VQSTPIYEEREDLLYEQMETRVEEAVRDTLTSAWVYWVEYSRRL
jgi:hypothetical protein